VRIALCISDKFYLLTIVPNGLLSVPWISWCKKESQLSTFCCILLVNVLISQILRIGWLPLKIVYLGTDAVVIWIWVLVFSGPSGWAWAHVDHDSRM
jgi:hypothetical protein